MASAKYLLNPSTTYRLIGGIELTHFPIQRTLLNWFFFVFWKNSPPALYSDSFPESIWTARQIHLCRYGCRGVTRWREYFNSFFRLFNRWRGGRERGPWTRIDHRCCWWLLRLLLLLMLRGSNHSAETRKDRRRRRTRSHSNQPANRANIYRGVDGCYYWRD